MNICLILTTVFLCLLSIRDIRTRTIPGWVPPAFGAAAAVLHIFLGDMSLPHFFIALVPGALLVAVSLIFCSSIGIGDGMVVMACGGALGWKKEFAALTAALVICALFGTALLILKRAKRSDCLPFLPFLAVSHAVMLFAEVFL